MQSDLFVLFDSSLFLLTGYGGGIAAVVVSFFAIPCICIAGFVFLRLMYERKKRTKSQRFTAQDTDILVERSGMWCDIINSVN